MEPIWTSGLMKLRVDVEPEVARMESRVDFWFFEALISLVTLE